MMGVLLGGHMFSVPRDRLLVWLYLTVGSGVLLTAVEGWSSFHWVHEGRGVALWTKIALLCLIPWFWDYRVFLLALVVIIASVAAHMPGRFRYYSFVFGTVTAKSNCKPE